MSNNHPPLELSSLPSRHPATGVALLNCYGFAVVVRLSIDPTALPSGTMNREVTVDWRKRPGKVAATQVTRSIEWAAWWQSGDADTQAQRQTTCEQLSITMNENDLTGDAAIGIAALLSHDLEAAQWETVLPIGSGGDYFVRIQQPRSPIQLEVSGVRVDPTTSESSSRLRKKCDQVLTQARVGFVSVTTFSHGSPGDVHSYLHYVTKKRGSAGKKGGKGKKK